MAYAQNPKNAPLQVWPRFPIRFYSRNTNAVPTSTLLPHFICILQVIEWCLFPILSIPEKSIFVLGTIFLCRLNNASADDYPDVQLFLASGAENADGGLFGKRGCGLSDDFFANLFEDILYKESYAVIPLILRPHSRGYVKLRSADPSQPPKIVPNYFKDPRDMELLVRGSCGCFRRFFKL